RSTLAGAPACGGACAAASGRTTSDAGVSGAEGCRLATAASGGGGGAAGGNGPLATKAGSGGGPTQALAPVAAGPAGRGWAYWSLIAAIDAPVRATPPAAADRSTPAFETRALPESALSVAHAPSASAVVI